MEEDITSIAKYYQHFSVQETNRISQKLKIKNITVMDESQPGRKLDEVSELLAEFREFKAKLEENEKLEEYIDDKLIQEAFRALENIIQKLRGETIIKFDDAKSIHLLNHIIETFNEEISKKTGQPLKPTKTGFAEYSGNRIKIEVAVRKILKNMNVTIPPTREYAGSLGGQGGTVLSDFAKSPERISYR